MTVAGFRMGVVLLALLLGAQAIAQVPRPEAVLGFSPGEDGRLASWDRILSYLDRLASAGPRVRIERLGKSTEGRPLIVAMISHPRNLERLEELRRAQEVLADPRTSREGEEDPIARGRTVVVVTCGVHPTEAASPLTSLELAWRLASSSDPEIEEILENVLLLLVPAVNPDGVDLVFEWYRQTVGTPAEGTAPPRLSHPYAGHDLNRDWFHFSQPETRLLVERVFNRWFPQIVLDLHEMHPYGARLFVPPYVDPPDPEVDPLVRARTVELGSSIQSRLTAEGLRGVVIHAYFDSFSPSRAYSPYRGGVRILAEAAGVRLASPVFVPWSGMVPQRDYDPRRPSWNFPLPWPGGEWKLGDVVEYQLRTALATLSHAARHRKEWLRGFLDVAHRALQAGEPHAFVIPPGQRDPEAVDALLEILHRGRVEIHVASEDFQAVGVSVSPPLGERLRTRFSGGSFVILSAQPSGAFLRTLLQRQEYPLEPARPGAVRRPPYDVTAHTLGIQMGVEVYRIREPFAVAMRRLPRPPERSAELRGQGNYWLFSPSDGNSVRLINRLLESGRPVFTAPNGFRAEGRGFPIGTLMSVVPPGHPAEEEWTRELPVVVERLEIRPQLAWQRIHQPGIGLYRSAAAASDEGWTRWILERFGFAYHSLGDAELARGVPLGLDVVVVPHQPPAALRTGLTEPYPEELRGGLSKGGLEALRRFVEAGGTALFLGDSCLVAVEDWNLPVRNVAAELGRNRLDVPGALLRADVHPHHPLGFGLGRETALLFDNNPVLEPANAVTVLSYAPADLLLSGGAVGQDRLAGRTALAEVPLGRGRVILAAFRPQFRAQTRATFKVLFNGLYYSTYFR